MSVPPSAKLRLESAALISNWRALNDLSGDACAGAAVKADAYGLGARSVVEKLLQAGCREFYVANWREASELEDLISGAAQLSVLNGVRESDMPFALQSLAKPVLNSLEQVHRWAGTGRPCDIMINSGMNRLGVNPGDLSGQDLTQLDVDICMSHLACADEDVVQNPDQLAAFIVASDMVTAKRKSLANSAAIALGSAYHFDCTRPGLSLYGGIPRPELNDIIVQVATPQVEILQVRSLKAGDRVGYNAQYIADRDHDIAILAMGYADGYLRSFSGKGIFSVQDISLPVLGRVSMDLIAIDVTGAPQLREGDWVDCAYDLPEASKISGLSQYELITGLGQRFAREWY
ncbi:alanine racemase [Sphingomonadales bacterium EhC05]|uniref:alanine racemase n=1 Tax=Parasphingorhabdus sp. TaxID=2709688 RepID=UPI0007F4D9BE|nr:alanine racemase [Sphingomonadales bacterium EhC05]